MQSSIVRTSMSADDKVQVRVMVFPGGANLPLWVAEEKGFNLRERLKVALTPTPNSVALVRALMSGEQDIALSAFDNVAAYQEGQGEVSLDEPPDLFAFMAFSRGTLRLVVGPEVRSYAELRGRTLGVDALATGYSMALVKLLQLGGLAAGDYRLESIGGTAARAEALMQGKIAGTMITSPLELAPEAQGCRRLANAVDVLGPYQTIVGAARRSWAAGHRETLIAFIRANLAALEWLSEAAHRAEAVVIYRKHLPNAPQAAAERAVAVLAGEREGFVRDGRLDREAMLTVLRIRSELGRPAKQLDDPSRYIDESYYRSAAAGR
jgi:ABC-type nitrate/sulfonate/bicarbonate transport system substrate-binding protein